MKKHIAYFHSLLPNALADLNCTDGEQMVSWRGNKTFSFVCGVSYTGADIVPNGTVVPAAYPASVCVSACALIGSCVLAEWDRATNSCSLKTTFGESTQHPNIIAARLAWQPSDANATTARTTACNSTAASYGPSTSWMTVTASEHVTSTKNTTARAPSSSILSSLASLPSTSGVDEETVIVTVPYSSPPLLTSSAGPNPLLSSKTTSCGSPSRDLLISTSRTSEAPALPSSIGVASTGRKGKRGLLYTDTKYSNNFGGRGSQVSWASNWNATPGNGQASSGALKAELEFVPQLWNISSVSAFNTSMGVAKAVDHPAASATNMLGFNEGNQCGFGGICMKTEDQIKMLAESYKQNLQPYGKTARLGAPSVTNGPDGISWLQSFLKHCSDCQIDFLQSHWYGGTDGPQSYLEKFHAAFPGMKIWLTEFGLDSSNLPGTDEQGMVAFLKKSMEYLDKANYIERYAFFMAAPMNNSAALVNDDASLTEAGKVYNSYTAG